MAAADPVIKTDVFDEESTITARVTGYEIIRGHPMYTLQVTQRGAGESDMPTNSSSRTVLYRFNVFRDLHGALNQETRRQVNSFPKTHTRNKLGIGSSRNMLEDRRSRLDTWIQDLLQLYPSLPQSDRRRLDSLLHRTSSNDPEGDSRSSNLSAGPAHFQASPLRVQRRQSAQAKNVPVYSFEAAETGGSFNRTSMSARTRDMPGTLFQGLLNCSSLHMFDPDARDNGTSSAAGSGGKNYLVVLSHLAIHIFEPLGSTRRSSTGTSAESLTGQLVANLLLSEVLSVKSADAAADSPTFAIQDIECRSSVFHAESTTTCRKWVESISSAKNRFVGMAEKLDYPSSGHHVWALSITLFAPAYCRRLRGELSLCD